MNSNLFQVVLFIVLLLLMVKPLGWYMARVYENKSCGLDFLLRPVERLIYRFCNIRPQEEMNWKSYAVSVLVFSLASFLVVYFMQRFQYFLPFNPMKQEAIAPSLAFNTAVSFATNTNWQAYGGENTLSYFTQMAALTVQNFLSAAVGMSVLVALIRGITRRETGRIGNFWVDLVRSTVYILIPLAFVLALALASQGVVQSFKPSAEVSVLQPTTHNSITINTQTIPLGPAASQVAIKQLGTNGGGFFGANSAHPLENPTPLSNLLEALALLLIPASLCFTYGHMVRDRRQGLAIFAAMFIIFMPFLLNTLHFEQKGNPLLTTLGADQTAHFSTAYAPGGNMEGKEVRFGITGSALWTTATTAASNGSVNSMLDSYTPMGGLTPMWLMQLGEVVFGGAGSGLYGMILFIILTTFIAGLMVGRTPEYMGKKIEVFEMKMTCIAVLAMPIIVLLFTAIAARTGAGLASLGNPGAHGFSEILYTFTSTANNNGSSFAGLNANVSFYNILTGLAMLCGRFLIIIPVLAIAGSLAHKKLVPVTNGTLMTHTPLFMGLLIAIIIIIGALTFFPALALGPIVEHLNMISL
jgi:potassium-transporting ATPase potassium-binding subunit